MRTRLFFLFFSFFTLFLEPSYALLPTGQKPVSVVTAVTAAYTAKTSDDYITASGGTFTIALYPCAGNKGREITIKHTGTSLTQVITIDPSGAETFEGQTTYSLYTANETVKAVCNTNWRVVHHLAETDWARSTLTVNGTTSDPTFGNSGIPPYFYIQWRRSGKFAQIQVVYKQTNATGAAAGSGDYLLRMPTNLVIDTTSVFVDTTVYGVGITQAVGLIGISNMSTSATNSPGGVLIYGTQQFRIINAVGAWSSGAWAFTSANLECSADFMVPISGWQP